MPIVDVLVAALVLAVAAICVAERRLLGRLWLRMEDPRTIALFRIVTGVLLLAYMHGLAPLHDYLFTDEGLFLTDAAQQVFSHRQFAGYGHPNDPSSPAGFFDFAAFLTWLTGPKYSLLFFWDGPAAFRAHLFAFDFACVCFTLGLLTRVSKWMTWALLASIILRNSVFWAGEQVFLCFLFYLCLSRCGHAWSVDEWWKRRRQPSAPAYPLVPAWPRMLMILQTVPLWTVNGLAKTGEMWAAGDSFYYVLEHPQLRRWPMHGVAEIFGTNLLRSITWLVHAFEVFFPLVVVGLAIRAVRKHDERAGQPRIVTRAAWVVMAACAAGLAWTAWPAEVRSRLPFVAVNLAAFAIAQAAILRPRVPDVLMRWVLGRRVWVTLAVLFAAHLSVLMEVGLFTVMTMATGIVFFRGEEIGRFLGGAAGPVAEGPASGGRLRRVLIATFVSFHVLAVSVPLLPNGSSPIRARVERPLKAWIRFVHTWQHWRMFAPQGPKGSRDLRVQVWVGDQRIDVGRGFYADPEFEAGWARDKATKIVRRVSGRSGSWFRKWHARHVCRAWALAHHGVPPDRVRIYYTVSHTPPPEALAEDRERALAIAASGDSEFQIYEGVCATEVHGQLPAAVVRRHGLDQAKVPSFVPWERSRLQLWTAR